MKLSVCVLYQDGDDLVSWRKSLPKKNIQVIALRTNFDADIIEPKFEVIGITDELVGLQWSYNDFDEQFDFGYLRNKCDEYATGDWILHMDSDERFASPFEELWEYLDAMESSDVCSAYVSVFGVLPADSDVIARRRYINPNMRLLRNYKGIYWEGICHETIDLSARKLLFADTDIMLYHKGYSTNNEIMAKKCERNAKLLIREYQREKSERNWKYLLNTFTELKKLTKE